MIYERLLVLESDLIDKIPEVITAEKISDISDQSILAKYGIDKVF